jgi:cell pole-organizing protein PopZ
MSAQPKANEPSMEDILASIRRIIADDQVKDSPKADAVRASVAAALAEPKPAPVAPPPVVAPPVAAAPIDDDILDLDQPVLTPPVAANAPAVVDDFDLQFNEAPEPEPKPAPEPMPAPVVQAAAPPLLDPPVPEPVPTPVLRMTQAEPMPAPPPQPVPAAPDMSSLISGQVETHVQQAFASLAGTVMANNSRTLEDLVRDMMRPMIKTWLDDNLPSLVERLVRAEIERVARGGRS